MTKGERLIWDLFLMVKELMPATADNTRRQQEWAAKFHAMEHPEVPPGIAEQPEPPVPEEIEEPPEAAPADPHEHGVPNRGGAGSRRKRR